MQRRPHEHARLSLLQAASAVAISAVLLIVASGLVHPLGASLAAVAAVQALSFSLPTIWIARRRGSWLRVLALERISVRCAIGACVAGVGVAVLNVFIVLPIALEVVPEPPPEALERLAAGPLWAVLVGLAVVPAFCEELLFRGAVCRALRPRLGSVAAVVLASALFALSHLSLARAAPTFALGVFAGVALLRSRSTAAAMLVHLVHNAAILIADRHLDVDIIFHDYQYIAMIGGAATCAFGVAALRGSDPSP